MHLGVHSSADKCSSGRGWRCSCCMWVAGEPLWGTRGFLLLHWLISTLVLFLGLPSSTATLSFMLPKPESGSVGMGLSYTSGTWKGNEVHMMKYREEYWQVWLLVSVMSWSCRKINEVWCKQTAVLSDWKRNNDFFLVSERMYEANWVRMESDANFQVM